MGLRQVTGMRCLACGEELPLSAKVSCPACKASGTLDIRYDYAEAARTLDRSALERREPWMWRYRELLPLDELAELPPLQVGMTPIFGAPRLAKWAGVSGLWLKDEGRNPTGWLDDRAAALLVAQARESGKKVVAQASFESRSSAAIACLAASVGLEAAILSGPESEDGIAAAFGAHVFEIDGSPDEIQALKAEACARLGWMDASGPLVSEGEKTLGLELAEQLAERVPDWIALPAQGSLVRNLIKGLLEARALGWIRQLPKVLAVQLDGEEPGLEARLNTQALRETEGAVVVVQEDEIDDALAQIPPLAAVMPHASAADAVAGIRSAVRQSVVAAGQTVAAVIVGRQDFEEAPEPLAGRLKPDLEALASRARRQGLAK